MRYMVLIAGENTWAGLTEAEQAALYERIGSWWDEQAGQGRIVDGHELQGVETATTVRRGGDGNVTVTDGPFVEAKELMGGWALINVKSLEEAVGWAKRFRDIVGEGTSEICPVMFPEDFAAMQQGQ